MIRSSEEIKAENEARLKAQREKTADKIVKLAEEIVRRFEDGGRRAPGEPDHIMALYTASLQAAATYVAAEDWHVEIEL